MNLKDYLRQKQEEWLQQDWESNIYGDSTFYSWVDYDELIKAIDEFTKTFKK
jgi:hypothetical protein